MTRMFRIAVCLVAVALAAPTLYSAHFVWVASGPQAKDGKTHVYFSESVSPDDPSLLKKLTGMQLWQINEDGKATLLKTTQIDDSLVAAPVEAKNPVFVTSFDYGVISRGGDTFLLKYHAKSQAATKPAAWRAVNNPERLPMELIAKAENEQVVFQVLWNGKPLAGSVVTVTGPGIEQKLEGTSNDKGEVRIQLKSAGPYSIRAKHTEAVQETLEGKAYTAVRHYTTLSLSLSEDSLTAAVAPANPVVGLPALDPGITSFGAAIINDDLYVYGGHFGKPHHYSKVGQSDRLLRLNLKNPTQWEVMGTGPKRTGLTAVAYGGKFYRIGGFEARNEEADKQSLFSKSDFARFDPKTCQWEELTPMPEGRSSHDAVVIGNIMYVVGGWELQGEGNSKWHDTAYSVDLSADKIEWKPIAKPPFQRRALSLGEWRGKVSVIGGMQSEGGITTATAFFDPKTETWSEGPKLNGESMEGFGSSAFLLGDKLCVSTFAGNLQMLSDDGSKWILARKLAHPRFFHRMMPLNDSLAIIVGGASMQSGKIRELETISVVTNQAN